MGVVVCSIPPCLEVRKAAFVCFNVKCFIFFGCSMFVCPLRGGMCSFVFDADSSIVS